MSNAVLLAQKNAVTAVDILQEKIDLINRRKSPIADKELEGADVVIYEPTLKADSFYGSPVIHDLDELKRKSEVIVANRYEDVLEDVKDKVYTRDLFKRD